MALKSALDLRIPDAIYDHGCAATLSEIVTKVTVHPSKFSCLRRLMRVLTAAGIFSVRCSDDDGGEQVYGLTPASHLLVGNPNNIAPFLTLMLDRIMASPLNDLSKWFQLELPDPSLFEVMHGQPGVLFNEGMLADSNFVTDIIIKEGSDLFQDIISLIDVAGGLGGAAHAISNAFPHLECSVLELPHVVANAPTGTKVKYMAGDMFESIPPANAIFLKWVLHDWDDDKCVKILKNCKKAIPGRDEGGKIIVVDIVVGAGQSDLTNNEVQTLFVMSINGIERDEQEWKKVFLEAGFSDYKITPVLGVRSIIEVYP
ncbi:hypothetical protein HU200_011553 [Digitaria exilis]|uniref:Uncharacterized protein n=1 Tax=Digitaria exilis TaxID=1010633 RepID=A0A835FGG5_9POAL|nr:hypothetical protein HU200_011553 [Digitaria exilis]